MLLEISGEITPERMQSILKEISPGVFIGRTDAEVETPILCHLMQRTDSFEMTLMLGKIEGWRRRR